MQWGPNWATDFVKVRFRESPRRRWRRSSGTTRASFVRCCYRERDREGEKRARAQVGDLWSRASVIKLEFSLKRWRCRIWEDFDYRGAGFCCDRADSLEEASEEVSESNNCERTDGHCRFIPSSSFSSSSTLLRRIVAVCSDSEWIGSNVYLSIYFDRPVVVYSLPAATHKSTKPKWRELQRDSLVKEEARHGLMKEEEVYYQRKKAEKRVCTKNEERSFTYRES